MLVTNLTLTQLMMQIDGKKLGLDTLLGFEKLVCVAHSFEICRQHETESVRFVLAFFSLLHSSAEHPPLFVDVRRSSNFCEMVVNFYAVSSKRGRFTKAPSLKTS